LQYSGSYSCGYDVGESLDSRDVVDLCQYVVAPSEILQGERLGNTIMAIPSASPDPTPMAAHVEETVRSVALLHAKHHQDTSNAQRYVDRATALAGRPLFLGLVCCGVVLWIVTNSTMHLLGSNPIDPPPFAWLELAATVTALVMAVLILVTQRNADRLAEVRGQMTLELAQLTEQKAAKIIELVEELRRDSPAVRDRFDSEAHEMSVRTDPHAVLGAIKEVHKEMRAVIDQDKATVTDP
jgi:uncharacterized membrane protein